MSTLIAYASKYGCTEKCARKLSEKLEGKTDLYDFKSGKVIDLGQYDKVVIGGSIYVGKIQKEANDFCVNNMDTLKNKKVGLFICGMQSEEALDTELKTAYPEELMVKAVAKECLGGEFIFNKMSFIDKTIVKVIAKTSKDTSNINEDKISSFAQAMNNA